MRRLAVLLVVALVAAGAYLAVNLPSPQTLAARLEAAADATLGRRLTLGDVRLVPGLTPHLVADDIAIANPAGASRADLLTARHMDATLALLPLLGGDIVIEHLTIQDADIRLERAPDGTPNWQLASARHPLFGGNGPVTAGSVEVHAIHLEGGHLAMAAAPLPPVSATIAHANWAAESGTALMQATALLRAGDTDFSAKATAGSLDRLRGGPVAALAGAWPLTLDVVGGGATLHLEGGFTHPEEARAYDLRLTANAPEVAPLAALLGGRALPPFRELNFTTRLTDGSNGVLRPENLSLHLGAADLSGWAPTLMLKEAVLSAPGPGQQAQFSVEGTYQGAPLRASGTATEPDVLTPTAPITVALSFEAGQASLTARGTVPPGLGGQGLDLTVSAHTPDLAALAPLAGRDLPPIHDATFDARLGDAGFRLRGVAVRDLRFNSSAGDLQGQVTAAWSPVLSLSGQLASRMFDLDAFGLSLNRLGGGLPVPVPAPAGAPARLFSEAPLPLALLRGADGTLTVEAGSVTAGGARYQNLDATLRATGGRITLNPFRVTTPQGALAGALVVDASAAPATVAATLRAPALAAQAIGAVLGAPDALTGSAQVDLALSGAGDSPHALAATLAGHVGLAIVSGEIDRGALQAWLGATLAADGAPALPPGTTDLRCLAVRADIRHGIGAVRVLALDTPELSLDGDGSFDLGDETLALHLRPTVTAGATPVAAPVRLTGPMLAPQASLDPVMGRGRVGLVIGARPTRSCYTVLGVARGPLAGPAPVAAAASTLPIVPPAPGAKKPVDLLQGILH